MSEYLDGTDCSRNSVPIRQMTVIRVPYNATLFDVGLWVHWEMVGVRNNKIL